MLLSAQPSAWPYRHSSYDPCPQLRRNRFGNAASQRFFDYDDDEEDVFGMSPAGSLSLRPAYNSCRASPIPPSSAGSTRDVSPYFNEPPLSRAEVPQLPVRPIQMRSFNVDPRGRIVDCGFRCGRRPSRPLQRSNKSRRATCPEIWLSAADDEEEETRIITSVALQVYGAPNVGKRTLAQRMSQHADVSASQNVCDDVEDENAEEGEDGSCAPVQCCFMINEEEIDMEITHGMTSASSSVEIPPGAVQLQMIVYSVDSRDSFVRAAQLLYRLHDSRRSSPAVPTVLVANKFDLQRKRKVTALEGKMLAKIYKASFVETSALLSMNLDQLWQETLKKLQKAKSNRDRRFRQQQPFGASKSAQPNRLMGRIVKQGRRFAKSCEEIVARLASL